MLIGVVITGAVVIAGIGFAGSYAAVRALAIKKGFGDFAYFFPIGIDAGICVLLALDLLLTWIRMPFPLLRQTAWLLTVATVAFNAAAATDPLGMGMHAVIPVLFVVTVEAARHAVGRIADITADRHMEGVRLTRWLLSPLPTFLLWRRMKLWELRSYDAVIELEQERLVYQARLRSRFGRGWRRKAPVESLMPLRLARYGVPLARTAPAGLAAAGIEPQLLPAAPQQAVTSAAPAPTAHGPQAHEPAEELPSPWFAAPQQVTYQGDYDPTFVPEQGQGHEPSHDEHQGIPAHAAHDQAPVPVPAPRAPEPEPEHEPQVPVPTGAGGTRPLGKGVPKPDPQPAQEPAAAPTVDDLYLVFRRSLEGEGMPTPDAFAANLEAQYGLHLPPRDLTRFMDQFTNRLNTELMNDHIA
ncbi:membrane protein [Streptomyces natalensis ATCC 27448]|uniref:Membrane protein n=1 Tax=Streptomyces natalensis ATCC 27448 TaxID=1240678 RepID=A0A0D7CAL1_9ACTN|nr:membrane protein [Streptomyces natalensis ATCC 27448]